MTIKTQVKKFEVLDFKLYGDNDYPGPHLWAKFYDPVSGIVECNLPFHVCLDALHLIHATTAELRENADGERFLIVEVERQEWDGQLEVVTWTPTVHDFAHDNVPRHADEIVKAVWELATDGDAELLEMFAPVHNQNQA